MRVDRFLEKIQMIISKRVLDVWDLSCFQLRVVNCGICNDGRDSTLVLFVDRKRLTVHLLYFYIKGSVLSVFIFDFRFGASNC